MVLRAPWFGFQELVLRMVLRDFRVLGLGF
jgi:hypothetical protein